MRAAIWNWCAAASPVHLCSLLSADFPNNFKNGLSPSFRCDKKIGMTTKGTKSTKRPLAVIARVVGSNRRNTLVFLVSLVRFVVNFWP